MRQEAKEIDGPELEQAEERKRESELVEEREDELHDLDGQYETTVDPERRDSVILAMRAILEGDQIVINDLGFSKRHQIALEALKTAVEGKDSELARFVYAEDRRTLLEQALAILQPEIADLDHLSKPFEDLIKSVGELRGKLDTLEDAEEELVEGRAKDASKAESDSDDDDDEDDNDNDKDSEEDSDEEEDTSLTGPERKVAKPASSLTGLARKSEPQLPTTLGDPKEIAAAQSSKPGKATTRRRSGE